MRTVLFLFILSLLSCTGSKKATHSGIDSVQFGSGGGFTGLSTIYLLGSDGKLMQTDESMGRKNIVLIKTIDKEKVALFFEKANALKEYTYNSPDNMYSFIEMRFGEKTNKIVWGFDKTKVDSRAVTLYNELMELIK